MHLLVLLNFLPPLLVGSIFPNNLVDPAWDWEIPLEQTAEACLRVPNSTGFLPLEQTAEGAVWNATHGQPWTWIANSRLMHLAVPQGTPPPRGWPVLITLEIIPVTSELSPPTQCDYPLPKMPGPPLPPKPKIPQPCLDVIRRYCSAAELAKNRSSCSHCIFAANFTNASNCTMSRGKMGSRLCPPELPTPVPPRCIVNITTPCGGAYNRTDPANWTKCSNCVKGHKGNESFGHNCPKKVHGLITTICGSPLKKQHSRHFKTYPSWSSPRFLEQRCSCINGTKFGCSIPIDDGHAGHEFVPSGGYCDSTIFYGSMFHQRLIQSLLRNGVAVMKMNPYLYDAWNSYSDAWAQGYDKAAMDALNQMLRSEVNGTTAAAAAAAGGIPPLFRTLDPDRIAFRGWSGGSQMVSWMIEASARRVASDGPKSALGIKAGVFMAGGSYACYNSPPLAFGTCAKCVAEGAAAKANKSSMQGCSNPAAVHARGMAQPFCEYCCPMNYTEEWYVENASRYATHPHTLFGQVALDQSADSCASTNYHNTMIAHGAVSKRLVVAKDKIRCYSIGGAAGDPSVPLPARNLSRFCSDRNMSSIAHAQGWSSFVLPAFFPPTVRVCDWQQNCCYPTGEHLEGLGIPSRTS